MLKLSGVGPKSELEKLGIRVVVDNADVGENLNDHFTACIFLYIIMYIYYFFICIILLIIFECTVDYLLAGAFPVSSETANNFFLVK